MAKNIIILICTLLFSYAGQAQSVLVYESDLFQGTPKSFTGNVSWVGNDWNDKIVSIVVPEGYQLEVFRDANFQGPSKIFEGGRWNFPTGARDWNKQISSMKLTVASSKSVDAVTVYADALYKGASKTIPMNIEWVGNDWNDKISSIKIPPGYEVQLFEDANYQGPSKVITTNWTVSDSDLSWNDKISSIKVVKNSGPGGKTKFR